MTPAIRRITVFTLLLTPLMIFVSVVGLSSGTLYSRETASWLAQCVGQDLIDLVVVTPTLLISAFYVRRKSMPALFIWLGTTLYVSYMFVIYGFGVHFNRLFLVYSAVLGLSVYATIATIAALDLPAVKSWFDEKRSARTPSVLLLILALLFAAMWLKEVVPALIQNHVPQSILDVGLPTNPVQVLDLSILLPGFVVAAILLLRKQPWGYLFGSAFLVLATLMNVTIGALVLVMKLKGVAEGYAVAVVFAVLALVTWSVFVLFMGRRAA